MGRVHSIQSLGTLDGPGVRFVVFFQGCALRCSCCHNPDTWDFSGGKEMSAEKIVQKAVNYKDYFGRDGGITLSGGEPLSQSDFAREIFTLCHNEGINTCLDTSGSIYNESVSHLLDTTDRVLLDIKYTNEKQYLENVGCSIKKPLLFLEELEKRHIPTTLRQVIIPTLNDSEENMRELKKIISSHSCIDKVELLPFKKMCVTKYDSMNIPFPLKKVPECDKNRIAFLETLL